MHARAARWSCAHAAPRPSGRGAPRRARPTAASPRGALGDEVAELGRRNQTRTATLDFAAAEARRGVCSARDAKRYDGRTISRVDLRLGPGVRVGLPAPTAAASRR
jgi:hypothetical protein